MLVWLITGASRGLGALMAKAALEAGDSVIATARRPETIEASLGRHDRLLAAALDVNDEAEATAAVAAGVERFGRIDVLMNNAGYGLIGAVEELSTDELEAIFRTNVFGLVTVTRAVLPVMRRQRSGHVVNMSSVGAYQSNPAWGAYHASKAAVECLSEALLQELQPLGIRVSVIGPSYFQTSFMTDDSLSLARTVIPDYEASSGAARKVAAFAAAAASSNQPSAPASETNNPARLAKTMVDLVHRDEAPFRLPLGTTAIDRLETKCRFAMEELDRWRSMALME